MSSLRRLNSLECADASPPPLLTRKLARHSSLPSPSLFKPQDLPLLPSSSKSPHRTGRCGPHFSSPYRGYKRVGANRKLASSRSMPAWPSENEGDFCAQATTRLPSRRDSLQMEDSVVYKELCESICRLELPQTIGCMLNSKTASRPSAHGVVDKCRVEEKVSDVKGRPLSLRRQKRKDSPSVSVRSTDPVNGQRILLLSLDRQVQEGSSSVIDRGGNDEERNCLLSDVTGSVNGAIATFVFMMESLQELSLRLKRAVTSKADEQLHSMLAKVRQEMQETFLWLFQKVFACTPRLMLLTMILLTNFTSHSVGEHFALAVMPMGEPPTVALKSSLATNSSSTDGLLQLSRMHHVVSSNALSLASHNSLDPRPCEGGSGVGVVRVVRLGGEMDGEGAGYTLNEGSAISVEEDSHSGSSDAYEATVFRKCKLHKSGIGACSSGSNREEQHMLAALWQQVASKESSAIPLSGARHIWVAPIRAPALEADDYVCYDRTDLKYQQELSRNPSNSLLLVNYAQFLHVVRHDLDRSEELYKRAVKADPVDGELIGKYANFLWVARDNIEAADEAYKSALAADPSNAFHAGNYAHFLWNSGVEENDWPSPAPSYY